jgi:hypothetical protein
MGGWVDRGARLDVLEKRNVCYPYQELNPKFLNVQACIIVTLLTVLSRLVLVSIGYCYFEDGLSTCHFGEKNSACRVLAGKRRGKRPFGITSALKLG